MKIRAGKIEKIGIIISLIGLILFFQPLSPQIFTYGFCLLALGAVIFTLSGYLPRRTDRGETYLRDLLKWIAIVTCVLLFVISMSIILTPYLAVW